MKQFFKYIKVLFAGAGFGVLMELPILFSVLFTIGTMNLTAVSTTWTLFSFIGIVGVIAGKKLNKRIGDEKA